MNRIAMSVVEHLALERVFLLDARMEKASVLDRLVRALPYAKPQTAYNAVMAREKLGSTVIAPGLAIPHARLVDVPEIQAALGLSRAGISDNAAGGGVHVFLLFIGPANYMKKNLDFLASAAALFQDEGLLDALKLCETPAAALALLSEAEKR